MKVLFPTVFLVIGAAAWPANAAPPATPVEAEACERVLGRIEASGFAPGSISDQDLSELYGLAASNAKAVLPSLRATIERGRKLDADPEVLRDLADVVASSASTAAATLVADLAQADGKRFEPALRALFEYGKQQGDPIGLAYSISWRLRPDQIAWLAGWLSSWVTDRPDRSEAWARELASRGFFASAAADNLAEDRLLGATTEATRAAVTARLREREAGGLVRD